MKQTLSIILFFVLNVCASAQNVGKHYSDPTAGFSFIPPDNWVAEDLSGSRYKSIVGPPAGGVHPDFSIEDKDYKGTLSEFVAQYQNDMRYVSRNKIGYDKFQEAARVEFVTDAGQRGIKVKNEITTKLANEISAQSLELISFDYAFEAKSGKKFIFHCVMGTAAVAQIEPLCDASMKTLTFVK